MHSPECQYPKMGETKKRENLVGTDVLESKWEGQIRAWTNGGVKVASMNRLIEVSMAPLKLGPTGRRKL